MPSRSLFLVLLAIAGGDAFVPSNSASRGLVQQQKTALHFGIPGFLTPKSDDDDASSEPKEEKKIGMSGLVQLITAGAGSPFLGDFEGVDEETGNLMFSLEANNLTDEKGQSKQTQMPYFESGWVDEEENSGEGFKWPWDKK